MMTSLFKEERQKRIHALVEQSNSVNVNILADDFGVSVETIRRDLNTLEKMGILTRTYGGAISVVGQRKDNELNYGVHSRSNINLEEKKKIANYARELIRTGDVIYLSPGSTAYCLAEQLTDFNDLTILTNSLLITDLFINSLAINVIVIGGMLKRREMSLVEIINEDFISSIHIDKAFIGCTGIHPIHGLTNNDQREITTDSRIVPFCQNVVVLADSTKFGFVGKNTIASIDSISDVITTEKTSRAILDKLVQKGIKVHMADKYSGL